MLENTGIQPNKKHKTTGDFKVDVDPERRQKTTVV